MIAIYWLKFYEKIGISNANFSIKTPKMPCMARSLMGLMMYVIDFKSLDLSMTLHTDSIVQQGNTLWIDAIYHDSVCHATQIEIMVKTHRGKLSKLLNAQIKTVQIKHDGIYLRVDDMLPHDLFYHINIMLKNQKYAWCHYNEAKKYAYLRACFYYNRVHDGYCCDIEILGQYIQSKYDFLCAFGENLMGVGGYFGSDLDGFDDCFNLYRVKGVNLRWHQFNHSKFKEKPVIMQILYDNQVNVIKGF